MEAVKRDDRNGEGEEAGMGRGRKWEGKGRARGAFWQITIYDYTTGIQQAETLMFHKHNYGLERLFLLLVQLCGTTCCLHNRDTDSAQEAPQDSVILISSIVHYDDASRGRHRRRRQRRLRPNTGQGQNER